VVTHGRRRGIDVNLRTDLTRIVKKAGLTPWPRLWQNLRASRETELAAEHPSQIVCAGLGNSAPVAARHYLQVTEADLERAAGRALQNPAQQDASAGRTESNSTAANIELRESASPCDLIL
jgi:hypothetical protein